MALERARGSSRTKCCGSLVPYHNTRTCQVPVTVALLCACLAAVVLVAHGQGCGSGCFNNNDCTSIQCSQCRRGICQQGQTCGGSCIDSSDCNLAGNCTQCVQGVCNRGCGQPCNSTKECLGYGCNECSFGQCVLWQCNLYCDNDQVCQTGGYLGCATCDQLVHGGPGMCKSSCGDPCVSATDCPARCPYCIGGVCTVT